ncbi:MAG: efflux RND transporter periplasmic adaptor subunit [Armatimonadota bacterium]
MNHLKRCVTAGLCAVTVAAICFTSPGWSARPEATAPVAVQPASAAQPAPFPVAALPESWGSAERAKRPVAQQPQERRRSTALVDLPTPQTLSRMPVGRVQVGEGRVDPSRTMRQQALYVIKAQGAGIVEYLYGTDGVLQAGAPLVRLYDLNILSDLRIGESAMARFASSPFVIAGKSVGMPPLPPLDFPKPTALQRLLGIRPSAPRVTPAPQAAAPRAQLEGKKPQGALSRAAGLTPQPLTPVAVERNVKPPSVRGIARLSGQMSDLHERMSELNKTLAGVDEDIAAAQEKLAEAKDDASARERLYNQGVLARNVYEASKGRVAMLEEELTELRKKRSETTQAREALLRQIASLQDEMDRQVAERSQASEAQSEARAETGRRSTGAPIVSPPSDWFPRSTTSATRTAPAARLRSASHRQQSMAEAFPSPTRAPKPQLRRLPRVAGRGLRVTPEIPTVPLEVKRLAEPRWLEQAAPGDGLVVRQLVPNGSQVQPGTPLLEVANREWARVYGDISTADVKDFPKGAPVRVSFDSYPGVTLEGWINDVTPVENEGLARVEMVVVAREGYYDEDTYSSLEWLVLAAPMVEEDRAEAMEPAVEERTALQAGYAQIHELLPLVPPELGPGQEKVRQIEDDEFVGVLRLGELDAATVAAQQKPEQAQKLASLRKWRDSFTAGMTTGIFGNLVLTYPRDNEVGRAVEKMATAQVTHVPDRCARTMREALGWGLGDAAVWMNRLPERGYRARADGLARPGDILVWPFTYGPRRNQHIGVAVSQAGKLMLLSNLSGTLGTTELLGGYVAFYKPAEVAQAKANTAQ